MTINLNIPQSWNECSPGQLKKIASYLNKGYQSKILSLLLFFTLVNIKWYRFRAWFKVFVVLKNVPLSELQKYYKFIYTKIDLTSFIPVKKGLEPPADRLGNITIDELAHADDAFIKYHNTKNIEYLRFLTAVLYRETSGYGKRAPFIKEELSSRIKNLKNIDDNVLFAIMRSYQGSRDHIMSKFKKVFPPPPKEAIKKKKKSPTSSQFSKIILDLTGGKFGNYNETSQTNAYTFLADFNNKLTQQLKS